jgi:hypothetical protein
VATALPLFHTLLVIALTFAARLGIVEGLNARTTGLAEGGGNASEG